MQHKNPAMPETEYAGYALGRSERCTLALI
jgi:hypothetical protein